MARLLSYSQVNTFVSCPHKWHLGYVQGWRAREKSDALVLGTLMHKKIASWLRGEDVDRVSGSPYHDLMARAMMESFKSTIVPGRGFDPISVEEHIYYKHIYHGDFHGYVDCIADVGGYRVLIDWKTTTYPYAEWRAHNDDQLTAYAWLAEQHHRIDEVAFVTIQKPHGKVEWHRSVRTEEQMEDFAQKVRWARYQMADGVRHRNPGMGCRWCSFVGHCAHGEDLGVRNEREEADF